ncbi:hypothetical protein B0H14DRAFT_206896 [Mycena olivaceomarginata]|nr:hypothetical protein B0H14DRAFT_206896 [Mycena olivaceomarginata]
MYPVKFLRTGICSVLPLPPRAPDLCCPTSGTNTSDVSPMIQIFALANHLVPRKTHPVEYVARGVLSDSTFFSLLSGSCLVFPGASSNLTEAAYLCRAPPNFTTKFGHQRDPRACLRLTGSDSENQRSLACDRYAGSVSQRYGSKRPARKKSQFHWIHGNNYPGLSGRLLGCSHAPGPRKTLVPVSHDPALAREVSPPAACPVINHLPSSDSV